MIRAVPKPPPREKTPRKGLTRTGRLVTTTKLKPRGRTKEKKVERQRAFYASAKWKAIRKEALARAGHQCEYTILIGMRGGRLDDLVAGHPAIECDFFESRCHITTKLHVHHKTNTRFGGAELPEDLMVVCRTHHDEIERRDFPHRSHGR